MADPLRHDHLTDIAFAAALEVVSRDDAGRDVERRVVPVRPGDMQWNRVHLRRIFESEIAVYDPLGEVELEMDERGKLWSLDDPRHAPTSASVHTSEQEAMDAVAALLGKPPIELEAELVRKGDKAFLRVKNRGKGAKGPAGGFESKFFQKREEPEDEKPKGPPPDVIDAEVNAATGRVYKLRRAPAPPPEQKPS